MKVKKVKDKSAVIKVPPSSRVPIETSPNMFTHHVLMLCVGVRGAGKSVFITNYLRMLREEKKADRILVISPTILSNQALLESLGIDEDDCFDPEDKKTIPHILGVINDERDEYVADMEKIKRYNEFKKIVEGTTIPIDKIDPYMFLEFTDQLGALVKPKMKYGHRPCIHVFVDDCQSSKLFRDKRFLNLCIRHRHLGGIRKVKNGHKDQCGALGCSLYIAAQNFKAQGGGCPRAIRNNATQLVIVGKSKDQQELNDMYSSVAGEIDFESFMQSYEYATAEKHNSFVIDLHPKKNHPSRFRRNLNEFIIPSESKEANK